MSRRGTFPHPLAARRPDVTPRHLCGHATFVQEHQPLRVESAYPFPPPVAAGLDFDRVLFLRVERLFLSRSPIFCSTRQRCCTLTATPALSSSRSCNSVKVKSGCCRSRPRKLA